jgi:hypothetical protein
MAPLRGRPAAGEHESDGLLINFEMRVPEARSRPRH